MTTDVLIVGAGPTGLMLANQLGRRGVRATIIDRHSGPAQQSRAMAVHARTLEIYAQLGLSDRAVELGRPGTGANMWVEGTLKARIPFTDMGKDLSPFPYVLMLGQDENERLLGENLRQFGVDVQWNTELVALEPTSAHVSATIKMADGRTQVIDATYVAGCDGGRSGVRQMNGIGFPGAPYEHSFFVADTEATGSMVPDELNVQLWRTGFHLYFPMRGNNRWRVIGILPDGLEKKGDVTFEDLAPSLVRESRGALEFKKCLWFSTYRIHHRCTERFRDRRCFLLGDAAHVHSPMGGQGMNTGLQDAYNLAWKLALVVTGQADDALLDTYEAERMPVAHQLLATTDRAFQRVVSDHWLAGILRMHVVPKIASIAMSSLRVRKAAFRTLSQTGIGYPRSPLSRTLGVPNGKAPRAGARFPWVTLKFGRGGPEDLFKRMDDRRFNLIVIGQPAPASERFGLGDLLRIHEIPFDADNARTLSSVSIAAPAFYLLRPDGHIGLAGTLLDPTEVSRWLRDSHVRVDSAARQSVSTVASVGS